MIHTAIDCIAELDADPLAAETNALLVVRATSKVGDNSLESELARDLELLKKFIGNDDFGFDSIKFFGALWSHEPPHWFVNNEQ
ncbi:MAG: hypothetical protein R3C18_22875 [Planctomycetaceae bacterium]